MNLILMGFTRNNMYIVRYKKLLKQLSKEKKLPYLITDLTNIKYLTGFTGSSAIMIISGNKSVFISDSRYSEYAESILPKEIDFYLQKTSSVSAITEIVKKFKFKTLFIEDHGISLSMFNSIQNSLKDIKIMISENTVGQMRMTKDDDEIQIIRKAVNIADNCYSHLLKFIRAGITEWDVSVEIEHYYRTHGCTSSSFNSIVASGIGSSMPHYETSMNKKIKKGDIILIDMGCTYMGYNSDLTRTVFLDSLDEKMERIYSIVLEAQLKAEMAIKSGISTGFVDKKARGFIESQGYGENFGHALGHGVGLNVHEFPSLRADGIIKLKKNMTVTVEPGIYIPGLGGVRIEDVVLVTSQGCEIITSASKELTVL
jgi:Xaa-Pro aminopeptidase